MSINEALIEKTPEKWEKNPTFIIHAHPKGETWPLLTCSLPELNPHADAGIVN